MTITIYHNPRCSKSRETLALVQERHGNANVVEYLKNPPSAAELAGIIQKLDIRPAQLVRTKEARDAGLDISSLNDDQIINAMVEHPAIIERPIVVTQTTARIGRPPESVLDIL